MANTDDEMNEMFGSPPVDAYGLVSPPRAESPEEQKQKQEHLKLMRMPKDQFTQYINMPELSQDEKKRLSEAWNKANADPIGDTAAKFASQPWESAKSLASDAVTNPDWMTVPKLGAAALNAAQAATNYGVGLAAEAVPGQDAQEEMRLARDVVSIPDSMVGANPTTVAYEATRVGQGAKHVADKAIKALPEYDPNTARIFLGPKSKDFGKKKSEFEVWDEMGATPQEAFYRSGMTREPKENALMWELDDSTATFPDGFDDWLKQQASVGYKDEYSVPLENFLQHSDLYEQMPELKDYTVSVVGPDTVRNHGMSDSVQGWFNKENKEIVLTPALLRRGPDEIKSTLLHEIQHGVQTAEGWDDGSNVNRVNYQIYQAHSRLNPEEQRYVKLQADADKIQRRLKNGQFSKSQEATWRGSLHDRRSFLNKLAEELGIPPERRKALNEFATLQSEDVFNLYQKNTGETVARTTQARRDLDEFGRRSAYPFGEREFRNLDDQVLTSDTSKTLTNRELERILKNVDPVQSSLDDELLNLDAEKPRYAEGGMVMDNLEEASLPQEELPPGAVPQDVADDIDAKVSEGEFIIPANVVRFIGVDKLEGMVQNALTKLSDMEANGRIGGATGEPKFAEGGLVSADSKYSPNSAILGGAGGQEMTDYIGPNGEKLKVPTRGGVPIITLPPGYQPAKGAAAPTQGGGPKVPGAGQPAQASQDGTGFDEERVGLNKEITDWTTDDYSTYARSRSTESGRIGNLAVRSISSIMGLGKFLGAAQDHKQDQADKALAQMIQTGKDLSGNPLSAEQLESLKQSKSAVDAQYEPTTAEKVMGTAMNIVSAGPQKGGIVGSLVNEAKAQISDKLTGNRNPVKGLIEKVTDPLKDAAKDAINKSYAERQAAKEMAEPEKEEEEDDKDKKSSAQSSGQDGSGQASGNTTSGTGLVSRPTTETSTGSSYNGYGATDSSAPGRDN